MAQSPVTPVVAPKKIQPIAKIAAGTKLATAITPSRDSQDERHCEKARHARSGRPRWKTDETSPPAASAKAVASVTNPNPALAGSNASGTPRPTSSTSANPAPDAVVKKMIERAGCIRAAPPPHPNPLRPRGRRRGAAAASFSPLRPSGGGGRGPSRGDGMGGGDWGPKGETNTDPTFTPTADGRP